MEKQAEPSLDSLTGPEISALFDDLQNSCNKLKELFELSDSQRNLVNETTLCDEVVALGLRLEEVLTSLPLSNEVKTLTEFMEIKAIALWNKTVLVKTQSSDSRSKSYKSLILLRALSLSAFIAIPNRNMVPRNLVLLATMAYKVGYGWLDYEVSEECYTRAFNALKIARDAFRRMCDGSTKSAVERDLLAHKLDDLAAPILLLKLELAEIMNEYVTVDNNIGQVQSCLLKQPKQAGIVVIRCYNRAVSLFDSRNYDRSIMWARASRDVISIPTVNLQDEFCSKCFRLLSAALLERRRVNDFDEAYAMAVQANHLCPCMSGLYLQLQLAIEKKSDAYVKTSALDLFAFSSLTWQVAEAASDALISSLEKWESQEASVRHVEDVFTRISDILHTKFSESVNAAALASVRLRLLLFSGKFSDAHRLVEELPKIVVEQNELVGEVPSNFPHARLWKRADQLFEDGRFGEAAAWFEASLALLPSPFPLRAQVARNLVLSLIMDGDLQRADRHLCQALTLESRHPVAGRLLFKLRLQQRRTDEAKRKMLEEGDKEMLRWAAQTALDSSEVGLAAEIAEKLLLVEEDSEMKTKCLSFLGKCRLKSVVSCNGLESFVAMIEDFLKTTSKRNTGELSRVCLLLSGHTNQRGLKWRLCRVAAELTNEIEIERAARIQASNEAVRWARDCNEDELHQICNLAVEMTTTSISRSADLGLSLTEVRLLVVLRVEALVLSGDRRLLPTVRELLGKGDREVCQDIANLLFSYRRGEIFASVNEALRWTVKMAVMEKEEEAMEQYRRLISLHQDRYADCPGDPNNETLQIADELLNALKADKIQPGPPPSLHWILVTLWNIGVTLMVQDRVSGVTKVGVALSEQYCGIAIDLSQWCKEFRVCYGSMMDELQTKLSLLSGSVGSRDVHVQ